MTTTTTAIQVRRDTALNWTTNNPIPKEGEFCYETDTKKVKIGDGATRYNSLGYIALDNDKQDNLTFGEGINESNNVVKALTGLELADKIYSGVDLSVKFASEIANYTDIYAWIKARCTANNFEGIHIGDYFTYSQSAKSITDGTTTYSLPAKTMTATVAGIDTYYYYGDAGHVVTHHIDFITDDIGITLPFNPANSNNGTSSEKRPWLASALYAILNGIDNYSTSAYGDIAHGFNAATSGGVLQAMPQGLQDAITAKRMYLPERYSADGVLNYANSESWADMGKLWIPTEIEVYGCIMNAGGTKLEISSMDYEITGSPVQYPLFAGTAGDRNAKLSGRKMWWLASSVTNSTTNVCCVHPNGNASCTSSTTSVNTRICFRIAKNA